MGYGILKDKVALITGSAMGLGKGIALKFADEGAKVIINYSKSEEAAKETVRKIEMFGTDYLCLKADVTNVKDVDSLVTTTLKKFNRIDILVNNVGICPAKPFLEITEEEWDHVMNTNLKSIFLCTQRVIPEMLKQGKGRIINIASVDSLVGENYLSSYCASKGGVMTLTMELALEFGPKNITVNAIAPGTCDTPMNAPILENLKLKNEIIEGTPVKRIGLPADIGEAALFFARDGTEFTTGTMLFVDGGWMASSHLP